MDEDYGKNYYKLHYIYREFTIDFFQLDLNFLPKNASSFKFSKHNSNTMALCLTLRVNLGLSLRKTKQALKDLYNIDISHQSIANYCKSAAMCIKPFVDNYDYKTVLESTGKVFTAMKPISKSEASKPTSGSLWMPPVVPSFVIRCLITAVLGLVFSLCVWH